MKKNKLISQRQFGLSNIKRQWFFYEINIRKNFERNTCYGNTILKKLLHIEQTTKSDDIFFYSILPKTIQLEIEIYFSKKPDKTLSCAFLDIRKSQKDNF